MIKREEKVSSTFSFAFTNRTNLPERRLQFVRFDFSWKNENVKSFCDWRESFTRLPLSFRHRFRFDLHRKIEKKIPLKVSTNQPVIEFVCGSNSSSLTKNCCSSNGADNKLRLRNFENNPIEAKQQQQTTTIKQSRKILIKHELLVNEIIHSRLVEGLSCKFRLNQFLPRL